jgi:hypothetical protein
VTVEFPLARGHNLPGNLFSAEFHEKFPVPLASLIHYAVETGSHMTTRTAIRFRHLFATAITAAA